jgi:hypothetical protein
MWPPLWSSGQSSWLQIQKSGFDYRRYRIFWEVVGLERGPLNLVSTIEQLLKRKSSCSGLEIRDTAVEIRHADHVTLSVRKGWHYLRRQGRSLGCYSLLTDSGHGAKLKKVVSLASRPQRRGPGLCIYVPQRQGDQVILRDTGFTFRFPLRWRYSNGPPHRICSWSLTFYPHNTLISWLHHSLLKV